MQAFIYIVFGIIIVFLLVFTSAVRGNAWKQFLEKMSEKGKQ